MGSHARLAPSSAGRWFKCAGSVKLIETLNLPATTNDAALDGTRSHQLLETSLCSTVPPQDYLGLDLRDEHGRFMVHQDRIDRVTIAYNYTVEREAHWGLQVERHVNPGLVALRDDCKGTADIILFSVKDGVIEIVDYKDGFVEVLVKDNPQLLLYLIGALFIISDWRNKFTVFRTTIIQPKLLEMGKDAITSHDYTIEEVVAFMDEFIDAAAATDDPEAPLVPGDHCKYCPASPCPAQVSVIEDCFGVVSLDDTDVIAKFDVDMTPEDKLRQIIEAAPMIRDVLHAVEQKALARFQACAPIEGLKVIRGRGSKRWAHEPEAMAVKLKRMGIPKKVMFKETLLTPGQALKATWTSTKGEDKSLSKRQKEVLEKDYISQNPGKFKVVSDAQHGSPIVFDVSEHFSAIIPEGDL